MTVIHIQDKKFPGQPLHFESRTKHLRFADENNPATCKICLTMVERAKKHHAGPTIEDIAELAYGKIVEEAEKNKQ